ncbi:MAG: beta-lactamase family protein, partial [Caulobacterales bacterium]|nr:beta-lactamase family protein [Caulobacterales bacterium]
AASACAAAGPLSAEEMTAEEAEALYQQRYEALTTRTPGLGLGGYDTLGPVGGAEDWRPLPSAGDAERTIPDAALAAARDYAAANNSSAFIVWRDGRLEAEHYFGDTAHDTLLVSLSLAKPVSVIAVGRALAEGHLDTIDRPAADFFEEWRGTPKEAITIRQLLGMRSGLLPQGMDMSPDSVLNRAYLHPFHDEIILNDYPLTHEPGARYEYSNANSELIAPLIERATGVAYEEWIAAEVFAPLGARGGEVWMNRPGGTPHSGCCILLPADTYLRLAILLIQGGAWEGEQLLPEEYVATMRTPTEHNVNAGMGLYLGAPYRERRGAANPEFELGRTYHSEPYLADDLFLFDGNSNQVVYIVPSANLIILRTGSRPPKEPEWDNAYLPNTILNAIGE